MDYRKTLNLLKADFPMRANLPEREPEIVRWWQEIDIYRLVREQRRGAPVWILHDGPPYANGNIHLGQALNKILKDIAIKYQTMRGYDCPYVPGWDTQGLPTEQAVQREHGLDRHQVPVLEWRAKCAELARRYVDVQREQFQRLGVRGDWYHPYLTLDKEYQARQIEVFGKIALRGLVYRSLRPVYWCYHCETALAEDEIEYNTITSDAIYVAFRLRNAEEYFEGLPAGAQSCVIIWTTTPWTIPGNMATALGEHYRYVLVRVADRYYLLAEELLAQSMQEIGICDYEIIETKLGKELVGLLPVHPLYDRDSPVVLAEHVTLDQGTGAVHTAPGHGLEDYQVSLKYDLEVVSPLDDCGRFTEEAGDKLEGLVCDAANEKVLELLEARGALLARGTVEHEYPHCWRCHQPVIYRATLQWFMDIDQLREAALSEIAKTTWMPAWGESRIAGMVANRPDWCISRQRSWGVPLPVFYCAECGETLLTKETVAYVRDLVVEHGADVWFAREAKELLSPGTTCAKCGATSFVKEPDIMSVWFDSGVSHYCVLRTHPELDYPADLYLEGDDQYQCWFQTSLWAAVALGDPAPFKTVVGHGFFVDDSGQKLSKSKGNIIDPAEIYQQYGADVLRLWFTYADFRQKMHCSEHIFGQVAEAYRRIRNTVRFMLTNLQDFNPEADALAPAQMRELDRWILLRLNEIVERMTTAFDNWDWHLFYHDLHAFCATDLSAFYLDVLKDTLYTDLPDSPARRSAQTALWELLLALTKMIAPVLSFTADEVWQQCRKLDASLPASVQLADWPVVDEQFEDAQLRERWAQLLNVRRQVTSALEQAKDKGKIDQPLSAAVTIDAPEEELALLSSFGAQLKELFVVSSVAVRGHAGSDEELVVEVIQAPGEKCGRCWLRSESVGTQEGHPTLCTRCAKRVKLWRGMQA